MEKGRLLADVTFLYKVLHEIIDVYVEPYVDFHKETDHYAFTHNVKLTLKMRYARTNVLKLINYSCCQKPINDLHLSQVDES